MLTIGLTGPSGSGKGEVCSIFTKMGAYCIDTDIVYHQLLVPPSPCLDELIQAFGDSILNPDGTLSRPRLANLVFNAAPEEKENKHKKLNQITHKYVRMETEHILEICENEEQPFAVIDAPLLIESGFTNLCDYVISVLAPKDIRTDRIMKRDQLSQADALARINAQPDDSFYIRNSDYVIQNTGSFEGLREEVQKTYWAIMENES